MAATCQEVTINSEKFKSYQIETDTEMKELTENETIPTKQLLLSIVRMGSLTSIPKTLCIDHQDDETHL